MGGQWLLFAVLAREPGTGRGCAGSTATDSTFPARESDVLCRGIPSAGQRGRLPPLPGAQVTRLGVSVCTEPLTHARQGPGRGSRDGKLSDGAAGIVTLFGITALPGFYTL